jgi:2-dehydro-3-deoxyphosphogluconate aldolase / (4S)-4-hydroxy-2-oxoglutarate aldolase
MNAGNTLFETLEKTRLVPVYYNNDLNASVEIIKACYDGGIRVFEWVARGEKAIDHFSALKEFVQNHCAGMILGVGTILNPSQADAFIQKEAAFLVSPVFSKQVLDIANKNNIPYIPGCFTPTEIFNAYDAGCNWIKLFPGDSVAPGFIKSVKAVFPQVKLMVTGGVKPEKDNITEWMNRGADALGLGSQLFKDSTSEQIAIRIKSIL